MPLSTAQDQQCRARLAASNVSSCIAVQRVQAALVEPVLQPPLKRVARRHVMQKKQSSLRRHPCTRLVYMMCANHTNTAEAMQALLHLLCSAATCYSAVRRWCQRCVQTQSCMGGRVTPLSLLCCFDRLQCCCLLLALVQLKLRLYAVNAYALVDLLVPFAPVLGQVHLIKHLAALAGHHKAVLCRQAQPGSHSCHQSMGGDALEHVGNTAA